MNYGSKKAILKALLYWQIILACVYIPFQCLYFILFSQISSYLEQMYDVVVTFDIFSMVYFFIFLIYFAIFINYIPKKYKQPKQLFYSKKIILFRIFSIVSIFIDLITGVLLTITAFTKDDGLEEIVYIPNKKIKKTKTKLSKQAKIEIKKIKARRRKGEISKDYYERLKKDIIKKEKQLNE